MLEYMHKKRGFHWFKCETCRAGYDALQKQVEVLNNTLRDMKKTVDENTENIKDNQSRLDAVETVLNEQTDRHTNQLAGNREETEKSILDEINDRESRKNNLIIFNLEEPSIDESQGLDRKKLDEQKLENIFKEVGLNLTTKKNLRLQ